MAYQIANLLEKMSSVDKDFRFMALNDLLNELNKDAIKLDDDSERKVIRSLLRLLEDKNGEIQNQAVKCLAALVPRIKDVVVELCVDSLCVGVTAEREELRDISCMALKTVIGELPHPHNAAPHAEAVAANVCKRVTPRLLEALQQSQNVDKQTPAANAPKPLDVPIRIELLDIITELLTRYPKHIQAFHAQIEGVIQPELQSGRWAVRKRAMLALAQLTAVCAPDLFASALGTLVTRLKSESSCDGLRTYISALAACSKASGAADQRFAHYLHQVVPILLEYSDPENKSVHRGDGDGLNDELVEACLHAFEAFLTRRPKDMSPYMESIVQRCSFYLAYDPNYHYDQSDVIQMDVDAQQMNAGESDDSSDELDGAMNGESGMDETMSDEEDQYSDDDDVSWKVRRAAARCVQAAVVSCREHLVLMHTRLAPLLVQRMCEREDNVRVDIVNALIALLTHTRLLLPWAAVQQEHRMSTNGTAECLPASPQADALTEEQKTILTSLNALVRPLVVGARRQLADRRCAKTRPLSLQVLALAAALVPNAYPAKTMLKLVRSVERALGQRGANSSLKIDALRLVHSLLAHHTPQALWSSLSTVVSMCVNCASDQFYKVCAEALHTLARLIAVLAQCYTLGNVGDTDSANNMVRQIYVAVEDKLRATDIDQEVKEKAIRCTALLLAELGSSGALSKEELDHCVQVLLERMRNEMTRLTSVRAVHMVCTSAGASCVSADVVGDAVPLLAEFMRKNNRPLRMATLQLMLALVDARHKEYMHARLLDAVVVEAPSLISDADLQISHLTLTMLQKISLLHPSVVWDHGESVVTECGRLSHSALLHGATLSALCNLSEVLVRTAAKPQEAAMQMVEVTAGTLVGCNGGAAPQQNQFGRSVLVNVGRVCACSCAAAGSKCAEQWANTLLKQIQCGSTGCSEQQLCFGLLALGELGRRCATSLPKGVDATIVELMQHNGEEVKSAASLALGALAAGDLRAHLPLLLNEIERSQKLQYLLLHSLKEVICSDSGEQHCISPALKPFLESIWVSLWQHASCRVWECPQSNAPGTSTLDIDSAAKVRATCLTAVKFVLTERQRQADKVLKQCMPDFLTCLRDPDINVRRAALVMFNSAAHNKPGVMSGLLGSALPALYAETEVKKELVREVEMGPFKHTIDDGLDTRKAAFECMYTLLESCAVHVDVFEFCERLEAGLRDQHDIRLLCLAMLARLAALWPQQLLVRLDRVVEPLRMALVARPKSNCVKQELERLDELRRAAARALALVAARLQPHDVDRHAALAEAVNVVRSSPELRVVFESALADPRRDWSALSSSTSYPTGFEMH